MEFPKNYIKIYIDSTLESYEKTSSSRSRTSHHWPFDIPNTNLVIGLCAHPYSTAALLNGGGDDAVDNNNRRPAKKQVNSFQNNILYYIIHRYFQQARDRLKWRKINIPRILLPSSTSECSSSSSRLSPLHHRTNANANGLAKQIRKPITSLSSSSFFVVVLPSQKCHH